MTGPAGFPALLVQIAFTSVYNDTTPTWVDVTGDTKALSAMTARGRPDERALCEPAQYSILLDNRAGQYDADNPFGSYYGHIRPNKRVRIGATVGGTYYPIFTGWADSFVLSPDKTEATVTATDRFGMLANQTDTLNSRPDEYADVRITALLQHFGIGSTDRSINAATLGARTLAAHDYDGEAMLDALQNAAFGDGGLLFMSALGLVTFQTVKYRQISGATRARTSQARFGNDATAIGVLEDLDPQVSRTMMTNRVTITDCNGDDHVAEDTALQDAGDGIRELPLGDSLLLSTDAQDRVNDELALRKNPTPRYDSMSVDLLTLSATQQATVLGLELSDRITLAVIPPGLTSGTARDQWIEGIGHDVVISGGAKWTVTFPLSSAGDSATVIP